MLHSSDSSDRRIFLKRAGLLSGSFLASSFLSTEAQAVTAKASGEDELSILGPKEGFSPQVGTLVSMMTWMRFVVLQSVKGMKREELDYLFDEKANTIGAILLHLVATERIYFAITIDGRKDFDEKEKKLLEPAMALGDAGRASIKGHDLEFYLDWLKQTRETTLKALRERDDAWLMKVDPHYFFNAPTNNYCKWFHVVEHESNHNGQIKWLKSRLPGAGASGE